MVMVVLIVSFRLARDSLVVLVDGVFRMVFTALFRAIFALSFDSTVGITFGEVNPIPIISMNRTLSIYVFLVWLRLILPEPRAESFVYYIGS